MIPTAERTTGLTVPDELFGHDTSASICFGNFDGAMIHIALLP
jgi:hypothetical protein